MHSRQVSRPLRAPKSKRTFSTRARPTKTRGQAPVRAHRKLVVHSTAHRKFSAEPVTPNSQVQNFGVIGAGQMGTGIALVAAQITKLPTIIVDVDQAGLDRSKAFSEKYFEKNVTKGKITREEADAALNRMTFSTNLSAFEHTHYIVEAATENIALKQKLFQQLDHIAPQDAILATNTSSIAIGKIAAATKRPESVIGLHFMNPVPVMKLVEVIPGLRTSVNTLTKSLALADEMGKTTTQSRDNPGFIANRILMPYINEAAFVLQEGIATAQDIDTTMKLGTNVPMGPLALADFIGLDTCLSIMNVLHNDIGDTKYRPAYILQQYVEAGFLGKKTGQGFYKY